MAPRYRAVLACLCLAAWAAPALSDDDPFDFDLTQPLSEPTASWQVGGFVELGGRYFTVFDDWLSQRLFAQSDVKWTRGRWQVFAQGTAGMDPATWRYRDPFRSELREIYLRYDGDGLDLTIGKHRVAWGTADGIGTIDRVNAVDFRDPILNARTPSRRPSWLIRAQQRTGFGIFEAVWLPRGRDRKFPEPGSPWESGLPRPAEAGFEVSVDDPHRHEGGLRFLRYGRGLDWGLAVFDGYTDAPSASRFDGEVLRLVPVRIRTWNANAAAGLAQSTLRAEVAYTSSDGPEAERTGHWQAVAGWDRTLLVDLYVNLQVFYERADDGRSSRGGTFAVTKPVLDDAATLAVRGQWAQQGQRAVEASFEVHVNDELTVSLRALAFSGGSGSPLGAFPGHDFAELTVRWLY